MTFNFKIEPPYPLETSLVLVNGNILKASIVFMEPKGCLIEMKAPYFKTGDKVTLDFSLAGVANSNIREPSVIVKIYIQLKDGKPHYLAEVHFKKPNEANIQSIKDFLKHHKK